MPQEHGLSNRSHSPLRWPGGKAKLTRFTAHTLTLNDHPRIWVEPMRVAPGSPSTCCSPTGSTGSSSTTSTRAYTHSGIPSSTPPAGSSTGSAKSPSIMPAG